MTEKEYYKGELLQMISEIDSDAAMKYMYMIVKDIYHDEVERKK